MFRALDRLVHTFNKNSLRDYILTFTLLLILPVLVYAALQQTNLLQKASDDGFATIENGDFESGSYEVEIPSVDGVCPIQQVLGIAHAATGMETITIQPMADTFVNAWEPDANTYSSGASYYTYSTFSTRTQNVRHFLMKFTMPDIPEGSVITNARLWIYPTSRSNDNYVQLHAYELKRNWSDKVTWNKYDGSSAWATPGGTGSNDINTDEVGSAEITEVEKFISIDVTVAVQDWIENGVTNNGLLMTPTSSGNVQYDFASVDHWNVSLRPYLVVEHTPAAEPVDDPPPPVDPPVDDPPPADAPVPTGECHPKEVTQYCYEGFACNQGDLVGYYARTNDDGDPAVDCEQEGTVCCKPPAGVTYPDDMFDDTVGGSGGGGDAIGCPVGNIGVGWKRVGPTENHQHFEVTDEKGTDNSQKVESQDEGVGISQQINFDQNIQEYEISLWVYVDTGDVEVEIQGEFGGIDTTKVIETNLINTWEDLSFTSTAEEFIPTEISVSTSLLNTTFYVDGVVLDSVGEDSEKWWDTVDAVPINDDPLAGDDDDLSPGTTTDLANYYSDLEDGISAQRTDDLPISDKDTIQPIVLLNRDFYEANDGIDYEAHYRAEVSKAFEAVEDWYDGQIPGFDFNVLDVQVRQIDESIQECVEDTGDIGMCRSTLTYNYEHWTELESASSEYLTAVFLPLGTVSGRAFTANGGLILTGWLVPGFDHTEGVISDYPITQDGYYTDLWKYRNNAISHEVGHDLGLEHTYSPSIMSDPFRDDLVLLDNQNAGEKYVACNAPLNVGTDQCSGYVIGDERNEVSSLWQGQVTCDNESDPDDYNLTLQAVLYQYYNVGEIEWGFPDSIQDVQILNAEISQNVVVDLAGSRYRLVFPSESANSHFYEIIRFIQEPSSGHILMCDEHAIDCVKMNEGPFKVLLDWYCPMEVKSSGVVSCEQVNISDFDPLIYSRISYEECNEHQCQGLLNSYQNYSEDRYITGVDYYSDSYNYNLKFELRHTEYGNLSSYTYPDITFDKYCYVSDTCKGFFYADGHSVDVADVNHNFDLTSCTYRVVGISGIMTCGPENSILTNGLGRVYDSNRSFDGRFVQTDPYGRYLIDIAIATENVEGEHVLDFEERNEEEEILLRDTVDFFVDSSDNIHYMGNIFPPDEFDYHFDTCDSQTYETPTVNLSASQQTVYLGDSVTLTWSSTNAESCTASGAWSGSKATSGSQTVTPSSTGNHRYKLTCTNDTGGSAAKEVWISVENRSSSGVWGKVECDLSGSPTDIGYIDVSQNDIPLHTASIGADGIYNLNYEFQIGQKYAIRPRKTSEAEGVCISSATLENSEFKDTNGDGVGDTFCTDLSISPERHKNDGGCEHWDPSLDSSGDGIEFGYHKCSIPAGETCDDGGTLPLCRGNDFGTNRNILNMDKSPPAPETEGDNLKVCFYSKQASIPEGFAIYHNRDLDLKVFDESHTDKTYKPQNPDYNTGKSSSSLVCAKVPQSKLTGYDIFKAFPYSKNGEAGQYNTCTQSVESNFVSSVTNVQISSVYQTLYANHPSGYIDMTWQYNGPESNFRVYRVSSGSYEDRGLTDSNTRSFRDVNMPVNQEYHYQIIPWDIGELYAGESDSYIVYQPQGFAGAMYDGLDDQCRITGWARDQDTPTEPIRMDVYIDGTWQTGDYIMGSSANKYRSDLDDLFGGSQYAYHGFDIELGGGEILDDECHPIYAYALNADGTKGWSNQVVRNLDTTKSIGCSEYSTWDDVEAAHSDWGNATAVIRCNEPEGAGEVIEAAVDTTVHITKGAFMNISHFIFGSPYEGADEADAIAEPDGSGVTPLDANQDEDADHEGIDQVDQEDQEDQAGIEAKEADEEPEAWYSPVTKFFSGFYSR